MSASVEFSRFSPATTGNTKPLSIGFEITERCNLSCRHCNINRPASDRHAAESELPTEAILDIARQAVELGAVWCLLTGGEPLLRPDFETIYLGLKRMGLLTSVFTNATLLTAHHAALFRRYPPRDIEISVYGATRATYEAVTRVRGSYDRFIAGLDILEGLPYRLKSVVMQSNLHEQAAIAAFCRERTTDYYRFDPHLSLRYDRNPTANDTIRSERLTPRQIARLEAADTERTDALRRDADNLVCEAFETRTCNHLFHCGAGKQGFIVGADGALRLCAALWAVDTTYDLKAGTIADAWYRHIPAVRKQPAHNPVFLSDCQRCRLVNLCMGCPGITDLETGQMDGVSPYFCEVAQARATILEQTTCRP